MSQATPKRSALPVRWACPIGDNRVQLPYAFGQRRGTGLQDVRRLDLVDLTSADRGHILPAGTLGDSLAAHRLPAPRCDDDLWIASNHLSGVDDAIFRELF